MIKSSVFLLLANCFISQVYSSDLEQERYIRQGKLKRKSSKFTQNVRMTMPNSFFASDNDWRTTGVVYDELLSKDMQKKKYWKDVSYSQYDEDMWLINHWFYGMKNGIVIESGALDGILYSNSNVFETYLNWTSILVEADPENYRFLRINRPNAITVNGALCSEPRLLHYSSLGVIPVRGFVEFMTPSFMKQWHGKIFNNKTKIDDLPTVQCMPMKRLLKQLSVTHVDLWILDVEGAEESALQVS